MLCMYHQQKLLNLNEEYRLYTYYIECRPVNVLVLIGRITKLKP